MKNLAILGITGSIGKSAQNVVDNFSEDFNLTAFSVHKNISQINALVKKYNPQYAIITDDKSFNYFIKENGNKIKDTKILYGIDGINEICTSCHNDLILNAISGKSGLLPSLTVIDKGIDLALANKESVVCAGELIKKRLNETGSSLLPVDSEHSAIFSLLRKRNHTDVERIYLTASGGPFRETPKNQWQDITIQQALAHPTWSMGQKISIDSATMANKGLEVIEAHYLFDFDYDKITVVIHPQSLIHSMIETIDGEIYTQMGPKDMSLPIQNAFFYPYVAYNGYNRLKLDTSIEITLSPVDFERFPMLSMAYTTGRKGGMFPAFYNIANEDLVHLFLSGEIGFIDIEIYMKKLLELFEHSDLSSEVHFSFDFLTELELFVNKKIKEIVKK